MEPSKLFIKWECGCVSFSQPTTDGEYLVVTACDADTRGLPRDVQFFTRDMHRDAGTESKPVSTEEETALIDKLACIIRAGHRWQALKDLMLEE
jgi:hypothetical protein